MNNLFCLFECLDGHVKNNHENIYFITPEILSFFIFNSYHNFSLILEILLTKLREPYIFSYGSHQPWWIFFFFSSFDTSLLRSDTLYKKPLSMSVYEGGYPGGDWYPTILTIGLCPLPPPSSPLHPPPPYPLRLTHTALTNGHKHTLLCIGKFLLP